jgi:hypothetical protein
VTLASASLEHSVCRAPEFAVADELAPADARELAEADAEDDSLTLYFAVATPPLPSANEVGVPGDCARGPAAARAASAARPPAASPIFRVPLIFMLLA